MLKRESCIQHTRHKVVLDDARRAQLYVVQSKAGRTRKASGADTSCEPVERGGDLRRDGLLSLTASASCSEPAVCSGDSESG